MKTIREIAERIAADLHSGGIQPKTSDYLHLTNENVYHSRWAKNLMATRIEELLLQELTPNALRSILREESPR